MNSYHVFVLVSLMIKMYIYNKFMIIKQIKYFVNLIIKIYK